MLSAFSSPLRYAQGRNAIHSLGAEMQRLGIEGPVLLVAGRTARRDLDKQLRDSLEGAEYKLSVDSFGGESSAEEIDRIKGRAKSYGAKTIVGAGGGKLIDGSRAAARELGLSLVICPTVASSDAPTSASSVVYTPAGVFDHYRFYKRNPDLVLADTTVIAKSPVRYLVAGMGDALATWFEAQACAEARKATPGGGLASEAGLALAELCYRTLLNDASDAKRAAEESAVTPALERIVEANTLLSGIGFESGGLAAAHSIHNGLTVVEDTHPYLHGEKVAFGTLVQLVLEGKPRELVHDVLEFSSEVGLPITLEEVGLHKPYPEQLEEIARRAVAEGETIHNEPFAVTADMVVDAIRAADAIGREYQDRELLM